MSKYDPTADLPPPVYDWKQQDFDAKVAAATERSLHQAFISGPSSSANIDDFETWSDEKFEAAARAYEARQARRRAEATSQPVASGSSSASASNYTSPRRPQYNLPRSQDQLPERSQTPRASDYASTVPYSSPPPPPSVLPPGPTYPSNATNPTHPPLSQPRPIVDEDEPIAHLGGGLQRAQSLFRTPTVSRQDHGEQLPAFTDVALPEEMVPDNMIQNTPTHPPQAPAAPQSPPPPHAFAPQSPPPPHAFSPPQGPPPPGPPHPVGPTPPVQNASVRVPPPLNTSQFSPASSVSGPSSPIQTPVTPPDPPPAFVPSNQSYPIPEKLNQYANLQLGQTKAVSRPMSIYASANNTYKAPTIQFDLETALGRRKSPGLDEASKAGGASFYSSAVSSAMSRPLPKPGGARPPHRTTLPSPSPWEVPSGDGQHGTYGNPASQYPPQHQQPYQQGVYYAQPVQQPYYPQTQAPPQAPQWGSQYSNYNVTPPSGQGWGAPPPPSWPGNGGYYHQ